jgi:hypothetical protein
VLAKEPVELTIVNDKPVRSVASIEQGANALLAALDALTYCVT